MTGTTVMAATRGFLTSVALGFINPKRYLRWIPPADRFIVVQHKQDV